MNAEQRALVEGSAWAVNTALKRLGVSRDNDLRQEAYLYLCKCAERFDPSKATWNTYAYTSAYLRIKWLLRERRKKTTLLFCYEDDRESDEETAEIYQDIVLSLNEREKKIAFMVSDGCTLSEIAKELGESIKKIRQEWETLKDRIKADYSN